MKPLTDEISGTVFRVFLQKIAITPTGSPKSSKNFLGKRKNSGVIEFSGKQSLKHGNERYAACSDEVYNCALLQSGVFTQKTASLKVKRFDEMHLILIA